MIDARGVNLNPPAFTDRMRRENLPSQVLRPLDVIRLRFLKLITPWAIPVIRRRDLRVAMFGSAMVLVALSLTLVVPFWLLALGPIIWGTPHVLSDIRYLVVRPGIHRRARLWLPASALIVLAGCGFHSIQSGLAAAAVVAVMADGPAVRKCLVVGVVAGLIWAATAAGDVSMIVFAHSHNFIAVLLWWFWRPRIRLLHAVVPVLFLLASMSLLLGWLVPLAHGFEWIPSGMDASYHLQALAPGIEATWGLRLVVLFAFAQAVHYGVWLRLIPEDDRPQSTPRTFAASARAVHADLGTVLLVVAGVLVLGISIWAAFDLANARVGYLRAALFHGYLELAAAAFLVVEGVRHHSSP